MPKRRVQRQPDTAVEDEMPSSDVMLVQWQSDTAARGSISSANAFWAQWPPDTAVEDSFSLSNANVVSVSNAAIDGWAGSQQLNSYTGPRLLNSASAASNCLSFPFGAASEGFLPSVFSASSPASQNTNLRAPSWRAPCLSPEKPLAFSTEAVQGWCKAVSLEACSVQVPLSLLHHVKTFRLSTRLFEQMLANMTVKLRTVFLTVFGAMDELMAQISPPPPKASSLPDWALDSKTWKDSARCGMLTLRFDRCWEYISGVDVNCMWAEQCAGLHREEFLGRALAGEHRFPTTDLRALANLADQAHFWFQHALQTVREFGSFKASRIPRQPAIYRRMSRQWGRSDRGPGVLLRMRRETTFDPVNPDWCYQRITMVEISEEEYEAVRTVTPEVCEGFMIPLVGSQSAAELLDPDLEQKESLAVLNSTPAGCAMLDRLADKMLCDFACVFEELEARRVARHVVGPCSAHVTAHVTQPCAVSGDAPARFEPLSSSRDAS